MARAQEGDIVRVYCAGRLTDGREFEMGEDGAPLELILGHRDILPELEKAIVGMTPGESKVVVVTKDRGYGPRRDDLIQVVDRKDFPEGITPRVGQRLRLPTDNYEVLSATVKEVTDTHVVVDGNHPLAGEDVLFQITLLEIVTL
ncbi:MAG: FKBP-type peptidyl-prolyl cis-trans isomerase [Planctomycetota bacterium]|jgi:peptidylprolyl isomerase